MFVRPSRFGWPFVHTRCAPQITTGMTGTCASYAMRAAPDLKSLISKLRLIVASGYTPTSAPRRSLATAAWNESVPAVRSTGMCLSARMIGPVTLLSKTSFFAMKRM